MHLTFYAILVVKTAQNLNVLNQFQDWAQKNNVLLLRAPRKEQNLDLAS